MMIWTHSWYSWQLPPSFHITTGLWNRDIRVGGGAWTKVSQKVEMLNEGETIETFEKAEYTGLSFMWTEAQE